MTHEDAGHYAAKHPKGAKVKDELLRAVKEVAREETISCAEAFTVARNLDVQPREVGMAIDMLEIKIEKCQLGLFGYGSQKRILEPAEEINEEIKSAIENVLVEGRISCAECWEIAARFKRPKMYVASVCEAISVKISPCQLGSF